MKDSIAMSNNEDNGLLESASARHLENNDAVDCYKYRKEILFSQSYSCFDELCCKSCILEFYK